MRSSKGALLQLSVIVLLGVCCAGCKRTSLTINADKNYDGRTLTLRVGDGVKLSLAENPATGYRWEFLAKPEPVCVIVSDTYVASTGGAIGSGGRTTGSFALSTRGLRTSAWGTGGRGRRMRLRRRSFH
jgi:predicted secreted protein